MTKNNMNLRIMKGVGIGSVGQLISIFSRILIIPLFLTAWGADKYGEWLLLSTIPAWLALSDFGCQIYFINKLTFAWAKNDFIIYNNLLATATKIFIFIPLLIFVVSTLTIIIIPGDILFSFKKITNNEAKHALILLILLISISLFQGFIFGLFRTVSDVSKSLIYSISLNTIQTLITAVCLKMNYGIIEIIIAQLIPLILVTYVAILELSNNKYKIKLSYNSKSNKSIIYESISPSLHFLSIQFSQAIIIQGSIIVISILGGTQVAVFSILRTIINIVKQILGIFSHSVWPEITNLYALNKKKELNDLYEKIYLISLIICIFFTVFISYFGAILFEIWLNNLIEYNVTLIKSILLYVLISSYWNINGNVLMSINKHLILSKFQLIFSILAIYLCWLGTKTNYLEFAIYGLIIGEAVPMVIVSTYLISKNEVNINLNSILKNIILYFLVLISITTEPVYSLLILIYCFIKLLKKD